MQCKDGTPLFAVLCISSYWFQWPSRAGYFLVAQNTLFLGTVKQFLTLVLFAVASQLHSISLANISVTAWGSKIWRRVWFLTTSPKACVFGICLPPDVKKVENISENILLCILLQLITEGRWVSVELVIKGKIDLLVVKYLCIWLKCLGGAKSWPVMISFMCNWWFNQTVLVCSSISASQAAKNYCEFQSYRLSCMKFEK